MIVQGCRAALDATMCAAAPQAPNSASHNGEAQNSRDRPAGGHARNAGLVRGAGRAERIHGAVRAGVQLLVSTSLREKEHFYRMKPNSNCIFVRFSLAYVGLIRF